MATREVRTWVCDLCDGDVPEEEVEHHVVAVDGVAVVVDTHSLCWRPVEEAVAPVLRKGVKPARDGRRRVRRIRAAT